MTTFPRPTSEQAAEIRATADILMDQRIDSAPVIKDLFAQSPGDWPEDFAHDNGCYRCTCSTCARSFTGYKRRLMCKICAEIAASEATLREGLIRKAGLDPAQWLLVTPTERARDMGAVGQLVLEANVERNLRRELAAALRNLQGQVEQARDGFGLYRNSPTMADALAKAERLHESSARRDAEIAAKDTARREGKTT